MRFYTSCMLLALALASCSSGTSSVVPNARTHQRNVATAPVGSHNDASHRLVDSAGRPLAYDAESGTWLSLYQGHAFDANRTQAETLQPIPHRLTVQDCTTDNNASSARRSSFDCSTDPGGAIGAPPPSTVTSLNDNGGGSYSDQLGNNWNYCDSCTTPASSSESSVTQGQWLQIIAYSTSSNSSSAVAIYEDTGFEALDTALYLSATNNKSPTAYKNYQNRTPIYFNVDHFYARSIACHVTGTQDQFIDAVAANLNAQIAAGEWSNPFKIYDQPTMIYQSMTLQYSAFHFAIDDDYLIGSAFFPQFNGKNC